MCMCAAYVVCTYVFYLENGMYVCVSALRSICIGLLKQTVQRRLFSVSHTAVNTSAKTLVGPNGSITLISPLFKAHLSPK